MVDAQRDARNSTGGCYRSRADWLGPSTNRH
jgi:hypothetical protein